MNGIWLIFGGGRSSFRQCLNLGECHSPLRDVVMNGIWLIFGGGDRLFVNV
ncbi:MAG: hypothetical protein ACM65L_21030 [Microcoleus sp.]